MSPLLTKQAATFAESFPSEVRVKMIVTVMPIRATTPICVVNENAFRELDLGMMIRRCEFWKNIH